MKKSYDVVVIGSGFGGAVTACRLAQAGRQVCILERGKRWGKGDFPRTTGQVSKKAFWSSKKSYGFIEYRAFKNIDVIQASGVGGGSLCYFNVHLRTPEKVIQRFKWPEAVTRNILDPYYDLVKDMLQAVPLTPPEGRKMPPKTEAFLTAVEKAGKKPELVDIAVYTDPDRNAPHGPNIQSPCVYSGNCLFGCHVHAKSTLDLNYIPLAEENGAEVYPLHQVFKIAPESEGYRVYFRRLDEDEPGKWEEGSVSGKKVIVSAGSLGSTELLMQCRDNYETLPELSGQLGKRFSINGEMIFAGTMFPDEEIDPGYGIPITAYADFSTSNNNIIIEDLGFPDPLVWYLEGAIPTGGRLKRMVKLLKLYLLQSIGIRKRSTRVSDEIDAITSGSIMTRFLPYLALGTDAGDGIMSLRDGSMDVKWSHRGSRDMYKELEQALRDISRAVNGKYIRSVLWQWPLRKLLVAHPLGGCIMGNSVQDGVVNHCGEAWNYPGLYVADGSVIPSALSVNPSMTIGAIAERTAFWILHNREMKPDDQEKPQN